VLKLKNNSGAKRLKKHILYSIKFLPNILPFVRQCEKYVTARQATEYSIIRRMLFAVWITKATDPHLEYVILIASPR